MDTVNVINIEIDEGIPFVMEVVLLGENDTPVKLHGFQFLLEVKESQFHKSAYITLNTQTNSIIVDNENGTVSVLFNAESTKGKTSGVYDLIGFSPSGTPFKIARGAIKIIPTISKW